jgi:hypothetical protein
LVEYRIRRQEGQAAGGRAGRRALPEVERARNVVFHPGHDHQRAESASFNEDQIAVWTELR